MFLTIDIISSSWLLFKSGAILSKIGFGDSFWRLIEVKELINFVSGSFSCKSLKLGVLGELTFTTK